MHLLDLKTIYLQDLHMIGPRHRSYHIKNFELYVRLPKFLPRFFVDICSDEWSLCHLVYTFIFSQTVALLDCQNCKKKKKTKKPQQLINVIAS